MTYGEVKRIFQELKRTSPRNDLTVHITFTEDSFSKVYPLLSRTYRVSSDNKAFWPNMGGLFYLWVLFGWNRSGCPAGLVHGGGRKPRRLESGGLLHFREDAGCFGHFQLGQSRTGGRHNLLFLRGYLYPGSRTPCPRENSLAACKRRSNYLRRVGGVAYRSDIWILLAAGTASQ